MKKFIFSQLTFIMLLACFSGQAQNFSLGVKGGISIPNLTSGGSNETPLNTGYSSRLGPDFSIFGDFKVSNLFSIQPQIEYSSQGGKKDGLQAFTTPAQVQAEFPPGQAPQYLYANYNSSARLNYLMIPILAKFGWDLSKSSPWRFYADAGPFVSFLLSAHQVTSGSSQFYTDPGGTQPLPGGAQSFDGNQDIKNQLKSTNVGVEGNIGLAYKFGLSSVFVEGGFNYGFLNIQNVAADGKNNTGAATVQVGYSYWFGKK